LFNISFDNTAELILALLVLSRVHCSDRPGADHRLDHRHDIAVLGISALIGAVGRVRQTFSQASAGLLSTLLFVVVAAILLPTVFDLTERVAERG
jgi:Ca2+:H+ antiporter